MTASTSKKSAILKFVCGLWGLCFTPSFAQQTAIPQELVKRIKQATVSIVAFVNSNKDSSRGSGFFIGVNQVMTCKHVYLGGSKTRIRLAGGRLYPITRVLAEDEEADLITLEVKSPSPPVEPLLLADASPKDGEVIYLSFCPSGLDPSIDQSLVSAYQKGLRDFEDLELMQFSSAAYQSCSGGPVLNQRGQVVGVITRRINSENICFAIPLSQVARLAAQVMLQDTSYALGIYFLYDSLAQDYEKALRYFAKVVERDSGHVEAWFRMGFCQYRLGDFSNAIKTCDIALALRSDYVEAYMIKGWSHGQLRQEDEQVKMYEQALALKPAYAEGYYHLGLVHEKRGEYFKAFEAMLRAVQHDSQYALAHYHLGLIYLAQGDTASAHERLKILEGMDQDLARRLLLAIGEGNKQ